MDHVPAPRTRGVLVTLTATALALGGAATATAAPASTATSTDQRATAADRLSGRVAAGWLSRQFVDGTHLVTDFGGTSYDDPGLTLDAVLGFAAAKTNDVRGAKALYDKYPTPELALCKAAVVAPGASAPLTCSGTFGPKTTFSS